MGSMLKIFVSSVQKELENERLTVLALVNTDSFLSAHFNAVLYEHAPASPEKSTQECLKLLDSCDVCLSIVGKEYGRHDSNEISITHQEYRRAKTCKIPLLVFIKGEGTSGRDEQTLLWIDEIRRDDFKYKRFGNILNLQHEVRNSLLNLLKDRFGISPSADQETIAEQTIEAVSAFETQAIKRLPWKLLDHGLEAHVLMEETGYFQVVFKGPGKHLSRLRLPIRSETSFILPSVEQKMNNRQKKIIQHVIAEGSVTSGWCRSKFKIAYNTAFLDLKGLVDFGILKRTGEGRNTQYMPKK